jgi:hypothetical protein
MIAPRRQWGWLSRWVVPSILILDTGCEGDPDIVPCNESPECPSVDEDATDEDVRVLWAEGQKLVLSLDSQPSDVEVTAGEVVYVPDPDDPDCEGACRLTVKRLSITLKTLYFVSSEDSVKVENLTLAFEAPLELESPDAAGAVVPPDADTLTCGTVQGLLWSHRSTLGEDPRPDADARLVARATNEALTFDAVIPMTVDGTTVLGCRRFDLELSGTLTGATPFDQNPTLAASR